MSKLGDYSLIGPHGDDGVATDLLILDTNVLIDMRDFCFHGPHRAPSGLKELLLTFPCSTQGAVDIQYGWAAAEASWARGSGNDAIRRRGLVHSASEILRWDESRIEREFANRHAPVNRDKRWPAPIGLDDDIADPRMFLLANYGSLLYLLTLRTNRRVVDPLRCLEDYVAWTTNELGVRSSYALSLAVALLCGDSVAKQNSSAILKLSGSEDADAMASKSWNGAWDFFMTSLGEGYSYGLLPVVQPRPTVLVTRDKDPGLVRLMTEVRAVVDSGSERIPFTVVSGGLNKAISWQQVQSLIDLDPIEALSRFSRAPEILLRQAAAAVNRLERHLGTSAVLSHDGWML